jgi:mRNA interferase HicA
MSVEMLRVQAMAGKAGLQLQPGKGGHLKVRLGQRFSVLPLHGSAREIGKGLVERIKKDLGLK